MNNEIKLRTVYLLKRTDKEDDGTDLYIGSTSMNLKEWLWKHKSCVTGNRTSKLYTKMREIGVNNWQVVPLLTFTCGKNTIREFEGKWVEVLNTDLNTYSPLVIIMKKGVGSQTGSFTAETYKTKHIIATYVINPLDKR